MCEHRFINIYSERCLECGQKVGEDMEESKLDRDSAYRICALECAVNRAAQDGGINGDGVDVLGLAEAYYGWLGGKSETEQPTEEK